MSAIEICGNGHKVNFYCSTCNRLYCGDCCTSIHYLSGSNEHDVKLIKDCLDIEVQKQEDLFEQLKHISESAKEESLQKVAIAEESRESLSRFNAECERLQLNAQQTRDARRLNYPSQDASSPQPGDRAALDSASHLPVEEALVTVRAMNSSLEKLRDEWSPSNLKATVIRSVSPPSHTIEK